MCVNITLLLQTTTLYSSPPSPAAGADLTALNEVGPTALMATAHYGYYKKGVIISTNFIKHDAPS